MKNIIPLFLIATILFSCSNDTDSAQSEPFVLPFNSSNYWTYDITDDTQNNSRDSLYVGNDTVINGKTYKKMKAKDNVAFGFYSNSLNNNGVKVSGNKLLLSGTFSLNNDQNLPFNFSLVLDDFIAFDADAPLEGNPSARTGVIQEIVNGYPLIINYVLKSVGGSSYPTYTSPDGNTYSDVKSGKIVLNIKVTSTQDVGGFPITFTILQPQDVIISEQFVAKNIGVVHTHTISQYNLDSQFAQEISNQLNIPTSYIGNQFEYLDTYVVN